MTQSDKALITKKNLEERLMDVKSFRGNISSIEDLPDDIKAGQWFRLTAELVPHEVTNLREEVWVGNDSLFLREDGEVDEISFSSVADPTLVWTKMRHNYAYSYIYENASGDRTVVYRADETTGEMKWVDDVYKTIKFGEGADAEDADFISWLRYNGKFIGENHISAPAGACIIAQKDNPDPYADGDNWDILYTNDTGNSGNIKIEFKPATSYTTEEAKDLFEKPEDVVMMLIGATGIKTALYFIQKTGTDTSKTVSFISQELTESNIQFLATVDVTNTPDYSVTSVNIDAVPATVVDENTLDLDSAGKARIRESAIRNQHINASLRATDIHSDPAAAANDKLATEKAVSNARGYKHNISELSELPSSIKKGSVYRLSENITFPTQVTKLDGLNWTGNETIDIDVDHTFKMLFRNGTSTTRSSGYSKFILNPSSQELLYGTSDHAVTAYSGGAWTEALYKDIVFIGGDDTSNVDLINWLNANGTFTNLPPDVTVPAGACIVAEKDNPIPMVDGENWTVLHTEETTNVAFDNVTIDTNEDGELKVKDHGIKNTHINDELKSTSIPADVADATDYKLTTERAVKIELDKKSTFVGNGLSFTNREALRQHCISLSGNNNIYYGSCSLSQSGEAPTGDIYDFKINCYQGGSASDQAAVLEFTSFNPSTKKWVCFFNSQQNPKWKPWVEVGTNVKFDNITIGMNSDGELQVKDSGIEMRQINDNMKSTLITSDAADNRFSTAKAVYDIVKIAGHTLTATLDPTTYIMTLQLVDKEDNVLSTQTVDLPLESLVLNVEYVDTEDHPKSLKITLQSGTIIYVPLSDIIDGLENTSNKVTVINSGSTDVQYPSAKAVYTGLETKSPKFEEINLTGISGTLSAENLQKIKNNPHTVVLVLDNYRYRFNFNSASIYYFQKSISKTNNYISLHDSTGAWTMQDTTLATDDPVTTSTNGLMIASDKYKLNGIETGANKTVVDTALSSTSTNPVQNKVINTALTGKASTAVATTTANGLMSSTDKSKLDGIEAGAQKNPTIVDNLTTSDATKVLSAKQGKELRDTTIRLGTLSSKTRAQVFAEVGANQSVIFANVTFSSTSETPGGVAASTTFTVKVGKNTTGTYGTMIAENQGNGNTYMCNLSNGTPSAWVKFLMDNEISTTIKNALKGTIASGNTGFTIGGDVYNATKNNVEYKGTYSNYTREQLITLDDGKLKPYYARISFTEAESPESNASVIFLREMFIANTTNRVGTLRAQSVRTGKIYTCHPVATTTIASGWTDWVDSTSIFDEVTIGKNTNGEIEVKDNSITKEKVDGTIFEFEYSNGLTSLEKIIKGE